MCTGAGNRHPAGCLGASDHRYLGDRSCKRMRAVPPSGRTRDPSSSGRSEVKEKFPDERDRVKSLQFGMIYGRAAFSLALALGISQAEAERLLNDYFVNFPAVKQMIEKVHAFVLKHGYVDDMFGRRRYLPDAQLP